ncbi:hypothetical protein B0T24DRAFT_671668 [Lasiosphaeria ovina]|uniref:Uncharacterized protein n=1 Tax=Lasiosphaeria ovina TaxID=92902 RepID=A0AAE0MYF6_9PEZI|nr:hypothetical protein B0T24DRAFT_671668 [Lasiosphaeria ovina]
MHFQTSLGAAILGLATVASPAVAHTCRAPPPSRSESPGNAKAAATSCACSTLGLQSSYHTALYSTSDNLIDAFNTYRISKSCPNAPAKQTVAFTTRPTDVLARTALVTGRLAATTSAGAASTGTSGTGRVGGVQLGAV